MMLYVVRYQLGIDSKNHTTGTKESKVSVVILILFTYRTVLTERLYFLSNIIIITIIFFLIKKNSILL